MPICWESLRARYFAATALAARGPLGGDPGAIHDAEGKTGFRVVEDHQPQDVRQPLRQVGEISRNPLDSRHLRQGHVARHRVDGRFRHGVNPAFRRHLDALAAFLTEHILNRRDNLGHRHSDGLDVRAGQIQKLNRHVVCHVV